MVFVLYVKKWNTSKVVCNAGFRLDWPPVSSDCLAGATPTARLAYFVEKVPAMYPFQYLCRSQLSLVKATTNQIIY